LVPASERHARPRNVSRFRRLAVEWITAVSQPSRAGCCGRGWQFAVAGRPPVPPASAFRPLTHPAFLSTSLLRLSCFANAGSRSGYWSAQRQTAVASWPVVAATAGFPAPWFAALVATSASPVLWLEALVEPSELASRAVLSPR